MVKAVLQGALVTRQNKHLIEAVLVEDPTKTDGAGVVIGSMVTRVANNDRAAFIEWFALMQKHLRTIFGQAVKEGVLPAGDDGGHADFVMSDPITVEHGTLTKEQVELARRQAEERAGLDPRNAEALDALAGFQRAFSKFKGN